MGKLCSGSHSLCLDVTKSCPLPFVKANPMARSYVHGAAKYSAIGDRAGHLTRRKDIESSKDGRENTWENIIY